MEKVNELVGEGNAYDFGARVYDGRLGRWFKPDLMEAESPSWTPFRFGYDNPVRYMDITGNFEIDAATAAKYPKLNAYLENIAVEFAGKPEEFKKAFKQYSEMSDNQIADLLKYKLVPNGTPIMENQPSPRVLVCDLSSVSAAGATGYFSANDGLRISEVAVGTIEIEKKLVDYFENDHASQVETEAAELFLESTLFHESTHYGDILNGGTSQTVEANGTEGGQLFEIAVYGSEIGSSASATIESSIEATKDYVASRNYNSAATIDLRKKEMDQQMQHYFEDQKVTQDATKVIIR
jgi:RHS repeat-associated protein